MKCCIQLAVSVMHVQSLVTLSYKEQKYTHIKKKSIIKNPQNK